MIRPEDIVIADDGDVQMQGEVTSPVFLGSQARLTVTASGYVPAVDASNEAIPLTGASVSLRVREAKLCILPKGD